MHTWDPDRYLTFADERGRPFVELVARIGAGEPRTVVDLGCGAGNLTRLLVDRWPGARVVGVDSSAEMVERAAGVGGVTAELGDIREWARRGRAEGGQGRPDEEADVLVTNAALQWVPGHLDLLPSLVGRVADGGWFAMQVPGNFEEPSHTIRRDLAAEPDYAEHTAGVAAPDAHDAATYLTVLQDLGWQVDAWETTYLHVLEGQDPVFTWVSGTGARPTMQALPPELRPRFEAEFRARLREAYRADAQGRVVLPFRRVFVVAHRP
ncbi:methyltransferase domain-containing protein [Ornithinimicrobium pekingense]|uniref:Trans-aconitate 2-methyltransferase n=1 Tax=Ornithinimicrobium pekingense TaxID=384677 RepID=A0ABQ2F3S1_9MICO|nr:methyltransferase domain-containing protein [Ornithinimicrobium pekingense]GGK59228.1 trans-aconitate 2-methyltransferase [Ornithinimicrobium pekingense]